MSAWFTASGRWVCRARRRRRGEAVAAVVKQREPLMGTRAMMACTMGGSALLLLLSTAVVPLMIEVILQPLPLRTRVRIFTSRAPPLFTAVNATQHEHQFCLRFTPICTLQLSLNRPDHHNHHHQRNQYTRTAKKIMPVAFTSTSASIGIYIKSGL